MKALLRASKIEVHRIHDVSPVLKANIALLPKAIREDVERLYKISRSLRRDRELSFLGSEDLIPSEFYKEEDGEEALASARWLIERIREVCL